MSTTITTAGPTGASTTGGTSGPRLSADLGTFLTLLTTQLRNQDPTKPMDTEALTQQLTQFATVEQQMQGNATMGRLLELQQAGQLAGASSLVGQRVALETDRLPLQDGRAEVTLPAAGRASEVAVTVRDASGAAIRTTTLQLGAGPTRWQWDGRDQSGTRRPDGGYSVSVTGRTSDGTAVPVTSGVIGRVTGATRDGRDLLLRFGNTTIGYDKLRELTGGS